MGARAPAPTRPAHYDCMRQTATAGDDTPQTPQNCPDPEPGIVVRVSSPPALLAVIPHLIGFWPAASVVIIGLTPPRDRIRVTLRYDLPDPPDADLAADIAAHAAGVLSAQHLTEATAVGYGSETLVLPVADALRTQTWKAGIDLRDFLRVQDGRYWSYSCQDEDCCPAEGTPFDVARRSAVAVLDRDGMPVLSDRAALAGRVAPLGGGTAESMRRATRQAERHVAQLLRKVRTSSRLGAARHMIAAESLAAVGAMITRYRGGGRFATDDEVARITVALRDLR